MKLPMWGWGGEGRNRATNTACAFRGEIKMSWFHPPALAREWGLLRKPQLMAGGRSLRAWGTL